MDDVFLTYNFKKPEYIEENNLPFSDFSDIPYPQVDQSFVINTIPKEINQEVPKPVETIQEPIKTLPVIKSKPSVLNKSRRLSMTDFKKKLMPDAERVAQKLKIDPNVILAQSFLESGGDINKPLFGIKAQKNYKGNSKSYNTKENIDGKTISINDKFRTYDSISDSFDDYGNLISGQRYASAIGKSPLEYYTILKNQGYATAKNYIDSLMKVYNQMSKS